MATRGPDPKARRLLVSCAWFDPTYGGAGSLNWEQRDDLRARVRLTSGSEPARATLWGFRSPDDTGPIFPAVPGESRQTRILPGQDGSTIAPYALREWDHVKIEIEGRSAPLFVGQVTGWRWNRQACRIEIVAQDARVLLNRIVCRGSYWYRIHLGGDPVWIDDWGPTFNAEGRKDQMVSGGIRLYSRFCTPDFTIDANNHAAAWRCGDALNALRDMFTVSKPAGLEAVDDFLEWPEAKPDGGRGAWDWLFVDPDTNYDRNLGELDCAGKKLGWAIDQILAAAGEYDWTLDYLASGKSKLRLFPTHDRLGDIDLSLGATGGAVQDDPPDVADCGLELDWSQTVKSVRAVGARHRVDLTLASTALVPLWGSAEQSAWVALSDASPEKNSQAYQDIFCTWGAPADLDWSAWLGAAFRDGAREALPLLATGMLDQTAAAYRPIQVPFRVWRYKGSVWEPLPPSIGAVLLKDRVGFRLAATARQVLSREAGATPESWSWYLAGGTTPTPYPMRVTLCVEADRRLVGTMPDTVENLRWPAGELYLRAGDKYRRDYPKSATLRSNSGSHPYVATINGGTDKVFDLANEGYVRNDYVELLSLAARKYRQAGIPMVRGELSLVTLRTDLGIGDVIRSLHDSGGARRVLPDIELYRAVRTLEFDDEAQVTTAGFEGI